MVARLLGFCCLGVALAGCSQSPHYVDNPSGDCQPSDDGAQTSHSPGDSQYLPDCSAPLDREYYRVFVQQDESAYMIPRPDASGIVYGFCAGDDAGERELFDRNGLCVEMGDSAVINSMSPEDALRIAHLLHERLVFAARERDGFWNVEPGPFSDDVVAACDREAVDLSGAEEACQFHRDKVSGRDNTDLGRGYSRLESVQLAAALNELYGID